MTPTYSGMLNAVSYETKNQINLIADTDQAGQEERSGRTRETRSQSATTTTTNQAKHWRVQFLRHSSAAETARGIPGITPPYCPAGPPLLRDTFEDYQDPIVAPILIRDKSPLRNLVLTNYSTRVNIKYASYIDASTSKHQFIGSRKMPHAISMPGSGFQAFVLCGPGIGLSTFTSVPSEYPKALINVANRPMVWYVLDWCYRMGVTDITLITPPTAKPVLAAALAQNPYLTSLPSPSPNLLSPQDLEFTTPTAELLRLPEVQYAIKSDFLLLPCDLICGVNGDTFLESYLTNMGGLGGMGARFGSDNATTTKFALGGEGSGRRGALTIWYNTTNREESVKGEECDFMGTAKMDNPNNTTILGQSELQTVTLRKLVWTMPMSELWDNVEENKSWKIRQSLLRKHGAVKCLTQFRDSHIYFFPYWVKKFAELNEDFESVSEDLVGTWAKAEWRKPEYSARLGARQIFSPEKQRLDESQQLERPIEDEVDLLSLSSTQVTQHSPNTTPYTMPTAQLASRVQADSKDGVLSPRLEADDDLDESTLPNMPPVLSYILPSEATAPLVRRVDTTPLLLSVSLLLAKIPSIDESVTTKSSSASPFAHPSKIASTVTIAQRTTISRSDTLIDSNSSIATQCVIKSSCIGSSVAVGTGTRITGCVIMDGATIGDKCVLTNTVIGKKAKIENGVTLQGCEVQDGNMVAKGTEGKGEKYLVGGLEDEVSGDEFEYGDDDGEDGDENEMDTEE